MRAAGHDVIVSHTRKESTAQPGGWLDVMLKGMDLLVVAGGDGAVRMAGGPSSRAGVPLYHYPFGTENLFAREFGMDREVATLLKAIEKWDIRAVDMGLANGEVFLLMASLGFDAEVVHELAKTRGKSISHLSYIRPIWKQLGSWRPAAFEIAVDGTPINPNNLPGFVVIANCKQYGARVNPAGRANMADGVLDVAFFPSPTRLHLVGWVIRCLLGMQFRDRRLIYRTGQTVAVHGSSDCRYQLDGDPAGDPYSQTTFHAGKRLLLTAEIKPGALRVLVP